MAVCVLVVEQEKQLRAQFVEILENAGHQVFATSNVPEAAEMFATHNIDVVLLDQLLTKGDVKRFCAGVLGAIPSTRVIATTASGSMRKAAEALEIGAFDYLVKPPTPQQLLCVVDNAERAISDPTEHVSAEEIAFEKAYLGANYSRAVMNAQGSAPMFLHGETGVGKSHCAEWMHKLSNRADLPYVEIDCAHVVGRALTDCLPSVLVENGGTLVLREPRKLQFAMQTQILRFLQTSMLQFRDDMQIFSDIRLICCSETAPEQDVDAGRIREDLFYRLKVMRMMFPPLRNRDEELPEIAHQLMLASAREVNKPFQSIDRQAREAISNLVFPRNLDDLEDLIRSAVAANYGTSLLLEMLSLENMQLAKKSQSALIGRAITNPEDRTLKELIDEGLALAEFEKLLIETAIQRCGGSITKAARLLDVSPSTIYRKKTTWEG